MPPHPQPPIHRAMSCLVFSGVTTEDKYTSANNKIKANYYCNSIADFFESSRGFVSFAPSSTYTPAPTAKASSGYAPQNAGDQKKRSEKSEL